MCILATDLSKWNWDGLCVSLALVFIFVLWSTTTIIPVQFSTKMTRKTEIVHADLDWMCLPKLSFFLKVQGFIIYIFDPLTRNSISVWMQQTLVTILPSSLLVVTFGSDEMSLHVNASSLRALVYLATVLACMMLTVLWRVVCPSDTE